MSDTSVIIPSAFQPLDTNITSDGSYANVRDLQILRKNHNILLARRLRLPLFNLRISDLNGTGDRLWSESHFVTSQTSSAPLCVPFRLSSPHIRELGIAIQAKGPVANPCYTYFSIDAAGAPPLLPAATTALEWDSGAIEEQIATIQISRKARRSSLDLMLTMFLQVGEGAATVKGTVTVIDVGPDWVLVSGWAGVPGDMLYGTGVAGRVVIAAEAYGANDKLTIDGTWSIKPALGATLSDRTGTYFTLRYINAWELAIDDFGAAGVDYDI